MQHMGCVPWDRKRFMGTAHGTTIDPWYAHEETHRRCLTPGIVSHGTEHVPRERSMGRFCGFSSSHGRALFPFGALWVDVLCPMGCFPSKTLCAMGQDTFHANGLWDVPWNWVRLIQSPMSKLLWQFPFHECVSNGTKHVPWDTTRPMGTSHGSSHWSDLARWEDPWDNLLDVLCPMGCVYWDRTRLIECPMKYQWDRNIEWAVSSRTKRVPLGRSGSMLKIQGPLIGLSSSHGTPHEKPIVRFSDFWGVVVGTEHAPWDRTRPMGTAHGSQLFPRGAPSNGSWVSTVPMRRPIKWFMGRRLCHGLWQTGQNTCHSNNTVHSTHGNEGWPKIACVDGRIQNRGRPVYSIYDSQTGSLTTERKRLWYCCTLSTTIYDIIFLEWSIML